MFRVRTFSEEHEATLESVDGPGQGKIERKAYDSGEDHFKLRLRALPSGLGSVSLFINDAIVADLEVHGGRVRVDWRSDRGDEVPDARTGQVAEIRLESRVLLRGSFVSD
jgi:hypothetical protein